MVLVFAPLSVMSFGGGQAIVADIQHQTVAVHHWFTDPQFADLFAVSRAAPGPNTLIASLIGWQLNGLLGALISTLAMYIPSSAVFVTATIFWHRHKGSRWRLAIERGLAPVAVGLIFAGALTVLEAIHISLFGWLTALGSGLVLYFTKTNPYLLILSIAMIYVFAFYLP
jgi:chromate transporter